MNALWGLFILASIIYGILIDGRFWMIYMSLIVAYYIFVMVQRNTRENNLRKTIMIATWGGKC